MKYQILISKDAAQCQWFVRRDASDAVEEYGNELGDGIHFIDVKPFDISSYVAAVEAYAMAKETRQGMYEAKAAADTAEAIAMNRRFS